MDTEGFPATDSTREVRSRHAGRPRPSTAPRRSVRAPRRTVRRTRSAVLAGATSFAFVAGCTSAPTPIADVPLAVSVITVDASASSVSFATAADVIGDDQLELVVSRFGKPLSSGGSVTIYERTGGLDEWTQHPVVTAADNIPFPNDTQVADLNGDGLADLIVGGGFFSCSFGPTGCGSLQWFEQAAAGGWVRHNLVAPSNSRFYHRGIPTDVNGDGILDIVTVRETNSSAQTVWFEGTAGSGAARFTATPHVIGSGGGSLPVVEDVDGDGDDDIVSPQFFHSGSTFVWFERTADPSPTTPSGTWVRRALNSAGLGRGFEVERVPNLLGDGEPRWLGTNHQNSVDSVRAGLFMISDTANPATPRPSERVSTGVAPRPTGLNVLAPGLFGTGDLNGDGRIDVVMSGDGDARLFALLQNADSSFTTYRLADDMGQAGGAEVTDLDGDGHPEALFTSYEKGVINLYEFGAPAA